MEPRPRTHPSPTTVWGARGRSFPRQHPHKRVNLKQPNRPAACSVWTPCRPPFSPALHSPSTRTRTPRALLRGGGCRCFQAFSTPHLRYVFPCTTLCFLYRISFTNGSVYRGYRCGFSAQFGPATHFSLGEIPPASTGFNGQ